MPQIINIVFGGRTPEIPQPKLKEMGFSVALYANAALQASLHAVYATLGALSATGSLATTASRLASFEERQRVVDKAFWDELESRYQH